MSYKDGMAALKLEFTDTVPRTEYSVLGHIKLMEKATGIMLTENYTPQDYLELQRKFCQAWNISFGWNVLIHSGYLGKYKSSMGHAVYAEGGVDRNDNVYCAFADEDAAFAFDPATMLPDYKEEDLIRQFNDHYKSSSDTFPDMANMTGIYITCMSGLIEMFGWDLLLTMAGEDSEKFGHLTERYTQWIEKFFIALAKSESPVVMIHDDIVWTEGAFINPAWYKKYIFPAYKRMFRYLREAGKIIMFTSDGNYTEFIDDIAACDINGFVMEPSTDMAYIAEKYGRTHSFIGNADTRILLYGTKDDIYREVKRCMDIGKRCPGFFMAVGNHIPANTPVDNCMYYDDFCRELGKR